jgi:hypothetical protein
MANASRSFTPGAAFVTRCSAFFAWQWHDTRK